jgi:hypothetical protein
LGAQAVEEKESDRISFLIDTDWSDWRSPRQEKVNDLCTVKLSIKFEGFDSVWIFYNWQDSLVSIEMV